VQKQAPLNEGHTYSYDQEQLIELPDAEKTNNKLTDQPEGWAKWFLSVYTMKEVRVWD